MFLGKKWNFFWKKFWWSHIYTNPPIGTQFRLNNTRFSLYTNFSFGRQLTLMYKASETTYTITTLFYF